jgi:hypothetical protein
VKKEQVDEFNKRVQKHLDDGHAEIERMKAEHAAKMQEWRKTKTLLQAEKRLRSATWEGHEAAVFRLEEPEVNDQTGDKRETVEKVLQDVEGILGVKFAGYADATLIEKGGWEEAEVQPAAQPSLSPEEQAGAQATEVPESKAEQLEPTVPANVPQPNVSPAPPQQQQDQQSQQQNVLQPDATMPSNTQAQGAFQQPQQHNPPSVSNSDLQLPEGMDLDTTDLQFPSAGVTPAQSGTPGQNQTPGETTGFSMPQNNTAPSEATASGVQQQPAQSQAQQAPAAVPNFGTQPGSTAASTGPQGTPAGGMGDLQDTSMFNDTFGDLAGDFGNDTGDGMIDFNVDSAFGDALHGMDTPGDGDMFGAGGGEGTGS